MRKMEDNSKHLELNEAKWDKWADTLDKKNWRNDYLRNAQSQVIALFRLGSNTPPLCGVIG
jgi:hypothetical protein